MGFGGLDVALPLWRELRDGLEMKLSIEALVEERNVVVARLHETGRFVGPFRGLAGHAPTGHEYSIIAMEWFEIEAERIARRRGARGPR